MKRRQRGLVPLYVAGLVVIGCNTIFSLDAPVLDDTICSDAALCADVDPCTYDDCINRRCIHVPKSGESPAELQTEDDCKTVRCGLGGLEEVNDDADVPADTECADSICTGGTLATAYADLGASCEGDKFCDGQGNCVECASDADCQGSDMPSDQCQTWGCAGDGTCQPSYQPMGTALVIQSAGDCRTEVCDGMGGQTHVADTGDIVDDGNACTVNTCNGDMPAVMNAPQGTVCGNGSLACNANGQCAGCTSATQCGMTTFCRTFTCANSTCASMNTQDGTPLLSGQTPNDCQELQCWGGTPQPKADDSDTHIDGNPCTSDGCSMGAPLHDPEPFDTPCSPPPMGYCNGATTCVECNNTSQCPPSANECQLAACTGNMCLLAPVMAGTPTATQVPYDCQQTQCDGMGGTMSVIDNGDVPLPDGDCWLGVCNAGMPDQVPKPFGTACPGGACDGAGECVMSSTSPSSSTGTTVSSTNTITATTGSSSAMRFTGFGGYASDPAYFDRLRWPGDEAW